MFYIVTKPATLKQWLVDAMRMCAVFVPWFALVLGTTVLILCRHRRGAPGIGADATLNDAAFCLAASGLFYMAAYLVIGVASDYRYQYWGLVAIDVAAVIAVTAHRRAFFPPSRSGLACIGVLVAALVAVQAAQIRARLAIPDDVLIDERTGQRITPL